MRVEGEGVVKPVLPHRGETRRVHEAESVLGESTVLKETTKVAS